MLDSLKIVEIGAIGPGPFCAMHLADLGAQVITVDRHEMAERPQVITNRGKRSIIADIKTPQGRELVLRLVEGADALIEGMRPGVMERLGLGPDVCAARNPRLVYGRMTGWGQSGPLAQAAGHDNNYIGVSGALYYAGTAQEPPSAPITMIGDVGGGALYLAVGILAGVLKARESGKGTVVDASITDGSAHMLQLILAGASKGMGFGSRGENVHDASPFFATYRCADGEHITVGSLEPQFYELLITKLGLDTDALFADQWDRSRWEAMRTKMANLFAQRTRAQWTEMLEGTDACFGQVLSPAEAARHPHNIARGVFFERDGVLQSLPAPRFDGDRKMPRKMPRRGEHTDLVQDRLRCGGPTAVWRDTAKD